MQRSLDMSDIYKPLNEHKSGRLANQFEQLWNEETKMKRPRLFNVIRKIYAKKIIGVSILFTVIDAISRFVKVDKKSKRESTISLNVIDNLFMEFFVYTLD